MARERAVSTRTVVVACSALLLVSLFPNPAGAEGPRVVSVRARSGPINFQLAGDPGSITFIQNGNVFILDPDAAAPDQVTTGGGYAWPTQDDSGTIVAVRQVQETVGGVTRTPRYLHRMNRKGSLLNPPVETVPADNSLYIGPLMPEVSPDGQYVAYHYFYQGAGDPDPTVCYSHSDQDTVNGELGCLGGYISPSWFDNSYIMNFNAPTSSFIDQVVLDQIGSVESTQWFIDETMDSLVHGEVNADRTRFAAVAYTGDQEFIALYEMTQPPPAEPVGKCLFTDPTEYFSEPTWSPDGRYLLFEDGDGIWAAEITDLDTCTVTAGLLLPGAEDPDWSPAPYNSSVDVTLKLGSPQSLSALLAGLKPKITCSSACTITAKLIADAATSRKYKIGSSSTVVGSGSGSLPSAGTKTVTVELTSQARKKLKNATRSFEVTLKVTGSSGGVKDVAKKVIKIVP